jgi:hypothetical protein
VDSGAQEKHAEVLFYGSLTDIQLASNFLIAETLHKQLQDLLFAGRHFDFIEMDHDLFLLGGCNSGTDFHQHVFRHWEGILGRGQVDQISLAL